MINFLKGSAWRFIWVGVAFASVVEFLTKGVAGNDYTNWFFTNIAWLVFLTLVYYTKWLLKYLGKHQLIIHFLLYGFIGLMIEWFALGLSPWSDPNAPVIIMGVFQLGMFAFWGSVSSLPIMFIDKSAAAKKIRQTLLKFYIPYFIVVLLIALSTTGTAQFLATIGLILLGYFITTGFYFKYVKAIRVKNF